MGGKAVECAENYARNPGLRCLIWSTLLLRVVPHTSSGTVAGTCPDLRGVPLAIQGPTLEQPTPGVSKLDRQSPPVRPAGKLQATGPTAE